MTPALDLLKKTAPNIAFTVMNMIRKRRHMGWRQRKSWVWSLHRFSRRCSLVPKKANYWSPSCRSSEHLI